MRFLTRLLCAATVLAIVGQTAVAGGIFLSNERFGYTGSWDRYATLDDAKNGVSLVESGLIPQRDLTFYITNDVDVGGDTTNYFIMLTRWYGPDAGNPNNVNDGFFQYYDDDSSTVQSLAASWNTSLTEYTLTAHVEGGDYASDFARFGERPGGPGSATEALFHEMDVGLTISGLTGAYNPGTGLYEGTDTSLASISGMITGIVENVGTDPTRHGFYSFSLTLNDTSWAYENGHVSDGESAEWSCKAVPEPASLALLLTGIPVIGLVRRKRFA